VILTILAAAFESDAGAELNENVDQNEKNDEINDDTDMAEERTLLPNLFRGALDEDVYKFGDDYKTIVRTKFTMKVINYV